MGSPETRGRLGARKNVNVKLRLDSLIKESVGWKRQGLGTTAGGVRGSSARDHCAYPGNRDLWIPRCSFGSGRVQKSEKGLVVVGARMRERSVLRDLSWRK